MFLINTDFISYLTQKVRTLQKLSKYILTKKDSI